MTVENEAAYAEGLNVHIHGPWRYAERRRMLLIVASYLVGCHRGG